MQPKLTPGAGRSHSRVGREQEVLSAGGRSWRFLLSEGGSEGGLGHLTELGLAWLGRENKGIRVLALFEADAAQRK